MPCPIPHKANFPHPTTTTHPRQRRHPAPPPRTPLMSRSWAHPAGDGGVLGLGAVREWEARWCTLLSPDRLTFTTFWGTLPTMPGLQRQLALLGILLCGCFHDLPK